MDRKEDIPDAETLVKYLTEVQKMYVQGESRETVFDYFLKTIIKITKSSLGFIADLQYDHNGDPFLHTIVMTDIPVLEKYMSNVDTVATKSQQRVGGGVNFKDFHGTAIGDLIQEKKTITRNKFYFDSKERHKSMPKEHPKINSFLGIPFLENDVITGVIVLCNTSCKGNEYNDRLIERISPVKYICSSLLKGFRNQSLKEIYSKIVNNINLPILVFQNRRYISNENIDENNTDLSSFICQVSNKAFSNLQIAAVKDDESLQESLIDIHNKPFYECFPNLIDNPTVKKRISCMLKSQETKQVDVLKYYDINVPEDLYTLKFSPIDHSTFIFTLQPISEQLKAKQMVEDIAKTKDDFVAKVSHEFRTPINAIVNIVALFYDVPFAQNNTPDAIDFREKLDMLSDSCVSLVSLVQDILDFSQLESKKLKLSYQTFDIENIVKSSMGMNTLTAQDKNIQLKKNIDKNVPICAVSDPKRIRQILINLLSNAIKFTEYGSVTLNVSLASAPRDGIYELLFSITDTGIGISKRDQKKIFKPFSQVDVDNNDPGTGLGLVISKHLVNLLGGKLWFESDIGKGSTFYFTILAKQCSMECIMDKYEYLLDNKVILVADSDKDNRIHCLKILSEWGIKVITCDNSYEAEAYLSSNTYDFDGYILDSDWKFQIKTQLSNTLYLTNSSYSSNNTIQRPVNKDVLFKFCVDISQDRHKKSSAKIEMLNRNNLKILLAEDNYVNRRVAVDILEKIGFSNVKTTINGEEAFEEYEYSVKTKDPYDVLLLDLKMPVLNGYNTFAKLKKVYGDDIPYTIALTASAMPSDKEKCLRLGMDEYISKPIDMNLLKIILENRVHTQNKLVL